MKNVSENRTMSVVLAELNASVDQYNATPLSDANTRVELALNHKKLVEEYNGLSLLNAYATCMKAEKPVIALAQMYYYDVISVKDNAHNEVVDGAMQSSVTRSVNDSTKKLDVTKFIEWTEECNKSVAADKTWKVKMGAARNSIETEWKKFFTSKGDSPALSVGKTKKALQSMFDALVFVATETNKNAIIANGDIAKWVIAFANSRKDSKVDGNINIVGSVLPKPTWNTLCLDVLHMAVTGKVFEITYGDPEENAETPAKAETKAE